MLPFADADVERFALQEGDDRQRGAVFFSHGTASPEEIFGRLSHCAMAVVGTASEEGEGGEPGCAAPTNLLEVVAFIVL